MNLIKLGQTILNLDQAIHIRDLGVKNASGQVTSRLIQVEFASGQTLDISQYADQFRGWLASNVVDLTPGDALI